MDLEGYGLRSQARYVLAVAALLAEDAGAELRRGLRMSRMEAGSTIC